MKVNPRAPKKDVCQTSIDILTQKTKAYLKNKFNINHDWIPDHDSAFPSESSVDGCVDVVLFGGFLKCFISSGNWPDFKYRFWVVSSCVRDVLVELLYIEARHISVISRYELFPVEKKLRPNGLVPPASNELFDLVFSGRISPSKNIECVVWLAYFLQTKHNIQVRLILIGDFDNMYSPDRGLYEYLSYENQIKNLIKSLSWNIEPVLMGKLGSEEWTQQKFYSPVLINLSTFISEDFDVSLAQAQQQGWPSLITNWGGHQDQRLENTRSLPWRLIGRSDEPKNVIELKSELLANHIIYNQREEGEQDNDINKVNSSAPEPINILELDIARRKLLAKFGPDTYLIDKEGSAAFADTKAGSSFFANYRNIMGQSTMATKGLSIILINDLNATKNILCMEIRENFLHIKSNLAKEEVALLISARDVLLVDNLTAITQSETIYFSFITKEIVSILNTVLFAGKQQLKIVIYVQKSCAPKIYEGLLSLSQNEKRIRLVKAE